MGEHLEPPIQDISSGSEVLMDSRGILTWPNSPRAFLTDRTHDVVHSCLAVSPGMRPESVNDVRHVLQEAVECLSSDCMAQSGTNRASSEQFASGTFSKAPPPDRSGSSSF